MLDVRGVRIWRCCPESCWCPIPGGTQGQGGWAAWSGMGNLPTANHWNGVGLKIPSSSSHSVIIWFLFPSRNPPDNSQPRSSILNVQCRRQTWGYRRMYCDFIGGVKELAYGVLLSTFPRNTCRKTKLFQKHAKIYTKGIAHFHASEISTLLICFPHFTQNFSQRMPHFPHCSIRKSLSKTHFHWLAPVCVCYLHWIRASILSLLGIWSTNAINYIFLSNYCIK